MKKIKSLKDLANLMESLGATKDEEPGFTSWTLDCGPGRQAPSDKQQAASVKQSPQFNDIKNYVKERSERNNRRAVEAF